MKTVLVEPLVITEEKLQEISKPLNENGNEFISYDTKPTSIEDWLERVADCEQLILANTVLPKEVIEQSNNLKYINIAFTGTDHVPVALAKEKGIIVSNAAGYSNEGVAELVIGLSISLMRNIKEADIEIRKGGKAADFLGTEISGKTVGIIGTGKIGRRVAELFNAFGVKLLGYSRTEREEAKELGIEYTSLENLLEQSDIVTLHLPQNEETKHFIGADCFKQMRETAIFINCARGPIVDNEALADALINKEIAGAGIDVFDIEPPLHESEALFNAPNAILTPHIAYFTEQAMEKRANIVFENAVDYLEGNDIKTRV